MPEILLHVPIPQDPRLAKICEAVIADTSADLTLDDWADRSGIGRRTLTRMFRRETGQSFSAWRQRVRLLEALARLGAGKSVTNVALDVGYESPQRLYGDVPPRTRRGAPPLFALERERSTCCDSIQSRKSGENLLAVSTDAWTWQSTQCCLWHRWARGCGEIVAMSGQARRQISLAQQIPLGFTMQLRRSLHGAIHNLARLAHQLFCDKTSVWRRKWPTREDRSL